MIMCSTSCPRSCSSPATYASPVDIRPRRLVPSTICSQTMPTAMQCFQNIFRSKIDCPSRISPPALGMPSKSSITCTDSTALRPASKPSSTTARSMLFTMEARPREWHRQSLSTLLDNAGSDATASMTSRASDVSEVVRSSRRTTTALSVGNSSSCCRISSTRRTC